MVHQQNEFSKDLIHTILQDYMDKIFAFALKRTINREDAEDLAQDIVFEVLRSSASLRDKSMKIYIVGPVSSGKSTLAKNLSETLNIPYQSLDEVVHMPDKSSSWGNRKRQAEERDKLFHSIIQQPKWIIEDVGRPCFEEGLQEADTIIFLEVSTQVRNYRIITRWIKQRLGIEKCAYNPRFEMLKCMLKWSKDYDSGKDNLKERIAPYQGKVVILRNNKDIHAFLRRCIT